MKKKTGSHMTAFPPYVQAWGFVMHTPNYAKILEGLWRPSQRHCCLASSEALQKCILEQDGVYRLSGHRAACLLVLG